MFHVYMMLMFGVLGFIMSKLGYPLAPLVLGIILGPMVENGLMQSLDIFDTNPWMIFFGNRGISAILVGLLMIILLSPLFVQIMKAKR